MLTPCVLTALHKNPKKPKPQTPATVQKKLKKKSLEK